MTWIVVPVNYFWRPEQNVNWARGLFYREQHVVPGLVYLLAYLVTITSWFIGQRIFCSRHGRSGKSVTETGPP